MRCNLNPGDPFKYNRRKCAGSKKKKKVITKIKKAAETNS